MKKFSAKEFLYESFKTGKLLEVARNYRFQHEESNDTTWWEDCDGLTAEKCVQMGYLLRKEWLVGVKDNYKPELVTKKVFSIGKYFEHSFRIGRLDYLIEDKLVCNKEGITTWWEKCDGKTEVQIRRLGFFTRPEWMVDVSVGDKDEDRV